MNCTLESTSLRAAFELVVRFAERAGVRVRQLERWGAEYFDLEQYQSGVLRRITLLARDDEGRVVVEASAHEADPRGNLAYPDAPWCWREIGRVEVTSGSFERRLEHLLEEARAYLGPLDRETLRQQYESMMGRVVGAVEPVVRAFAQQRGGKVDTSEWRAISITWPSSGPRYRIIVHASLRDGIWFECERRERVGILPLRRWVRLPEVVVEGLAVYDDQAGLEARLIQARRVLEELAPDQ